MRITILYGAVCALFLALLDFGRHTVPLLREKSQIVAKVQRNQAETLARLGKFGPPPTEQVLQKLQMARQRLAQISREEREELFFGARYSSDYLVPRARRPRPPEDAEIQDQLDQGLLQLGVLLSNWPAVKPANLGLDLAILSRVENRNLAETLDECERLQFTLWALDCLSRAESATLTTLVLSRAPSGDLRMDLSLVADISTAGFLYEQILAPTEGLAPRSLLHLELERLGPDRWGMNLAKLPGPPVRLTLSARLWRPNRGGQS